MIFEIHFKPVPDPLFEHVYCVPQPNRPNQGWPLMELLEKANLAGNSCLSSFGQYENSVCFINEK